MSIYPVAPLVAPLLAYSDAARASLQRDDLPADAGGSYAIEKK
jgi:hypothetical protein